MTRPSAELTDRTLRRCTDLGFAMAGVCEANPTRFARELLDWLAAGRHGEMSYLARNVQLRIDPGALVPGARSIIVVADRYAASPSGIDAHAGPSPVASRSATSPAPARLGRIARYARGDDYHQVIKRRLQVLRDELQSMFPHESFRACVDTAPVLERECAERAGLGAVGKNTLLIERGVGSWLLLGEIITSLPLVPSQAAESDPCGSCTRCIEACPTRAITPWSVDATACISYLTIEHRGAIDERFHAAMGDWLFGCDICQEVCPHNQPTLRTTQAPAHPAYAARRDGFDLLKVLGWDEAARRRAFMKSAMKRAKLPMLKRNALIAAGNALRHAPDEALAARLRRIASDETEDDMVRSTAQTVLRRLATAPAVGTDTAATSQR